MKKIISIALIGILLITIGICFVKGTQEVRRFEEKKELITWELHVMWQYVVDLRNNESVPWQDIQNSSDIILDELDEITTYYVEKNPPESIEVDKTVKCCSEFYYSIMEIYFLEESNAVNGVEDKDLKMLYTDALSSMERWG